MAAKQNTKIANGRRSGHSLDRFVGRTGTFTDFNGRVFACLVTGHDRQLLLKISYVRDQELISNAYIDRDNFEADSSNEKGQA